MGTLKTQLKWELNDPLTLTVFLFGFLMTGIAFVRDALRMGTVGMLNPFNPESAVHYAALIPKLALPGVSQEAYSVLVFDGTRGRFIANLTAMGNMYREVELPDSGTYYFVYRGNGTARIAIRTISTYPSERVLSVEYVSGGTLAFLLAALIWRGVRR